MVAQTVASAELVTSLRESPRRSTWQRVRPSLVRALIRVAIIVVACVAWQLCSWGTAPCCPTWG